VRNHTIFFPSTRNWGYFNEAGARVSGSYDFYGYSQSDEFTFSGFGRNDPKRHKRYGAGSYEKYDGAKQCLGAFTQYRRSTINAGATWNFTSYFQDLGLMDPSFTSGRSFPLGALDELNLSFVVYNNAVSDFYEKIRSSDINIALTAGERKESAKMLTGAFNALTSLTRSARKLKRELIHNPSLVLSSGWLQYKYGWLPFYSDIYNCLNFHFHLFSEMEFKGYSGRQIQRQYKTVATGYFSHTVYRTEKIKRKCLVIVEAGIANSDAYNLTRITSLNPLSIAWELTPLSFVFDWFIDVGGYLASMEASLFNGLTFNRGMVTELVRSSHIMDSNSYKEGKVWWTGLQGDWYQERYTLYDNCRNHVGKARWMLTAFPRPHLPAFKASLGSQRIISAGALIRQIVLGKVRH